MKRILTVPVLTLAVTSMLSYSVVSEKALLSRAAPAATTASPDSEVNLTELARRVVTSSAKIKPGDVVVIDGGEHTGMLPGKVLRRGPNSVG